MLVVELRSVITMEEDYGIEYTLPMDDDTVEMIIDELEVESLADVYIVNQYTDLPINVVGEELHYLNIGLRDLFEDVESYEEPYRWMEIKALLELGCIDKNDILYGFPHIENYKFYHLDTNVTVKEDENYRLVGISSDNILVKENELPF